MNVFYDMKPLAEISNSPTSVVDLPPVANLRLTILD